MKIYVASKLNHAEMWKEKRTAWQARGILIIAHWFDTMVADAEASKLYMGDEWIKNVDDIRACDALLIYKAEGDTALRGALVEVGMALMRGKPILACGAGVSNVHSDFGSWQFHPLVHHFSSIDAAFARMMVWKKTDIPSER